MPNLAKYEGGVWIPAKSDDIIYEQPHTGWSCIIPNVLYSFGWFSVQNHIRVYTGWSCIITDIRWPTVAAGAQVGKPSLPTGAGHWVPDLYNRKAGLNKRELTWTREVWLEHKKPDLNKRSIWFEDNEDEQKKKVLWKQLYQACT